jgi:glycosyltransferase involved in cell wall biosynthesis
VRIAILSWRSPGHPQSGGAETLTFEMLKRAAARGHEITWFAASSAEQPEETTSDGIRFVRQGRQWTVHLHAWCWLRRRKDTFDLIVDQINTLPFLTPLYIPEHKRRLLIYQTAREYWWRQTHGLFRLVAPFGYLLEPLYLKIYRSTRTITISESTRSELAKLGIPPARISVIPLAITTPVVKEVRSKKRPFRLIAISRLTPAKFVEEAVDAFAEVRVAVPDCVLDIVGSGDLRYRARLERKIAKRGLTGAVEFHGRVSEARKAELLERAHVHVFASHREGWGLTVTEAGACGTPTVGYDAPGVRDSVRDPRLLAALESGPAGLAERIVAVANDSSLYEEVREEAWRYARSLSYESTTDAFLEALNGE